MESEFQNRKTGWSDLSLDMKKVVYGMSVKCCRCGRYMMEDSKTVYKSRFIQIQTGLIFCSKDCLEEVVNIYKKDENMLAFDNTVQKHRIYIHDGKPVCRDAGGRDAWSGGRDTV